MLELLVKYGYYDDPDDIRAVLKHLKDMLDGESDGECLYLQWFDPSLTVNTC